MGDRTTAVQFYNQAVSTVKDKPTDEALQLAYNLFNSAALADPLWPEAWYQIGNNNSDLNMLPASVANYRMALQCPELSDECKGKALANLGWRLHGLGREAEALSASRAAVKMDPSLSYPWLNLSLIYGQMRECERSLECARKAFQLDPTNVTIELGLAFSLLFARKWKEGLAHFEARFPYKLTNFLLYPYPKWHGEPNRVIFLVADQGLGDTLSYARFVEQACRRSTHVYATIQSELMRLFQSAFSHISNLTLLPSPCPFPAADHWTTFVSLPFAMGLTDEQFESQTHIRIPAVRLPAPWKVSDRKLHIGIAFAGSALNDINKWRSIGLEWFLELYRVPGIQLYSLQCDDNHKHVTEQGCGALIPDLKPYIRDVVDTYSILGELDMVITIESALGHIAGAVGMETWVPYSYQGRDYRIGHTGTNPIWYPNHRIFPQGPDLSWDPVFARMVSALKRKVEQRDKAAA